MIEGMPFKRVHQTYGIAMNLPYETCKPSASKRGRKQHAKAEPPSHWDTQKQQALGRLIARVTNLLEGDGDIRSRIDLLENRLKTLESSHQCGSFGTFISSLGNPQVAVKKPIPVTIRSDGDEFIASFMDANISAGGDT